MQTQIIKHTKNNKLKSNFSGYKHKFERNIFLSNYLALKFISTLCIKNNNLINEIKPNLKDIFKFYLECKNQEIIFLYYENLKNEHVVNFITLPSYYDKEKKLDKIQKIIKNKSVKNIKIVSLREFYNNNIKDLHI